ncbi:MAG: hypothetical protein ABI416_14935 [Ginsengibacter sp.]
MMWFTTCRDSSSLFILSVNIEQLKNTYSGVKNYKNSAIIKQGIKRQERRTILLTVLVSPGINDR